MSLRDLLTTETPHKLDRREYISRFMVEIKPVMSVPEIVALLKRSGVVNQDEKTLCQTAHLLKSKGKYYLGHFRMLFHTEGMRSKITEVDLKRFNAVVQDLRDWGLVELVNPEMLKGVGYIRTNYKVVPVSERSDWTFKSNFNFKGAKRELPTKTDVQSRPDSTNCGRSKIRSGDRVERQTRRKENNHGRDRRSGTPGQGLRGW